MPYAYANLAQATASLAARLGDASFQFWTQAELSLYVTEALRTRNSLTNEWPADMVFSAPSVIVPSQNWFDISTITGSPRQRTVTDSDLYTVMRYHLLESPTATTLSGQFTAADLSQALQRRRDEMLLTGNLNIKLWNRPSTMSRREFMPDSCAQLQRIRWKPVQNPLGYTVSLLSREDQAAFEFYEVGSENTTQTPRAFSVVAEPLLAFDVDYLPPIPAMYEMIVTATGSAFAPPASTPMGIPDDLTWIAKWGAMADLFAMAGEATDMVRSQYCLSRYRDGLKLIQSQPWLLQARLNNMRVDTPSVTEMDQYSPGWEANANAPQCVVVGGMDLVSPCPTPTSVTGISLTVVGNAPVPSNPGAFIQCSQDGYDAVLDYAQHLALLKQGALEVEQGKELVRNFYLSAAEKNKRLASLGIYRDVLLAEGNRAEATYGRE